MERLRDGRDVRYIVYDSPLLLCMGLLVFFLKIGARRQVGFELNTDTAVDNFLHLCGCGRDKLPVGEDGKPGKLPHPDTVEHYLRLLPVEQIEKLRCLMVRRLLRMKVLENHRVYDYYTVAIDATGQFCFDRRHCEHCLTKTSKGKTTYYHNVLEAKLVTTSGLAFSIGTEFIENPSQNITKQDCELTAFVRLAAKLKRDFPQLRICLLADGLYANGTVFHIAQSNAWKYIITFKEGSLPALWGRYQTAKFENQNHHQRTRRDGAKQTFAWAEGLRHTDDQGRAHTVNALECREEVDGRTTTFGHLTNFKLPNSDAVVHVSTAGRSRWTIENQGFNTQKNGGYDLEHGYSLNPEAIKNWYLLLQIAMIPMVLLENSNLLGNIARVYGSLKAFARRLAESLRCHPVTPSAIDPAACSAIQIRLSSA